MGIKRYSTLQQCKNLPEFAAKFGWIARWRLQLCLRIYFLFCSKMIETSPRAADGKSFFVQQLANASDQQHFVVLIIAPVAAPLDRIKLGKFLFPITQHMRLHPAQFTYLADSEVALGRDERQFGIRRVEFH